MNIRIGTPLHVSVDPAAAGPTFAPAVVTRIHDDDTVNLKVFYDAPQNGYLTRVPVFPDALTAGNYLTQGPKDVVEQSSAYVAWIPAGDVEREEAISAMHALFTNDALDTPTVEDPAATGEPATV